MIVLASSSPRRAELLRQIGLSFVVDKPLAIETKVEGLMPENMVVTLALKKAKEVAKNHTKQVVLAADTTVVYKGIVLGKPADEAEAVKMLNLLSGDKHQVVTGFVLVNEQFNQIRKATATTTVWMKPLSESEIKWYVDTGESLDKAGGYGIQGKAAIYVTRIEGCYSNVVGLPLQKFYECYRDISKALKLRKEGNING